MKQNFLIVMSLSFISNLSFAQDKWDADGNIGVGNNAKLGPKNNKGFSIITDNQPAVNVTSNGTFNFIKPVNFTNRVKFDSLRILTYLDVDSIHCRTLKVGNSLTQNDAGPALPASIPRLFFQQLLNSSDNSTVLEGGTVASNFAGRDNVKFTIGYLNSGNGPQHKLNIHSNFNNNVFTSFTNINSYGAPNTFAATDGFKVGILANGIAQINQQENLPLQFHTNNTQRAVILANGRFGVNNTNPLNRFVVTSAVADFGGGNVANPGGSSGIRTTNMTSATPTLAGNGKVVTVNANGDFYLAPDGGGSGPAVVTAQNGLNTTFASPAVELGGTLLHNTDVNQNGNNLVWNGTGQFGIGTGLANSNSFNSLYNARFELNDNTVSNSMYIVNTTSGGAGGIIMDILSTGTTNYGHLLSVKNAQNNIGVSSAAIGAVGSNINQGIVSTAIEGKTLMGGILTAQTTDPNTSEAWGALNQLFLNQPLPDIFQTRRAASAS